MRQNGAMHPEAMKVEHPTTTATTRERMPNSWMTVLVASTLTIGGLLRFLIGLAELGATPDQWTANAPVALPGLVAGLLGLSAGIALGLAKRRAVALLALCMSWEIACAYLAQHGWAKLESGPGGLFVLLYSLYLLYNGRLGPVRPEASGMFAPGAR